MTSTTDMPREHRAMELVLRHMVAGYRVDFRALGEDGADGYELYTETRSGQYITGGGQTIPVACIALAVGLK